ncbi:MAG: glycerol-3-phosphate dehydrogenase [Rhizobiaceae bacterium]
MPVSTDQPQKASHVDMLIIGGGINGAGIVRDAVGRGFSVCLCEAGDFGGGTSSASTKLVHGGLRYLEFYEFRLVREALMEREVLWAMAPHIIRPLRFVLPHHKGLRPAWLLRLGLFIYDHLGGRKLLPPTRTLDLAADPAGKPLKPQFHKAFEYSDCWVEDSRLVVLNLRDAAARGADVRPRTAAEKARFENGVWHVRLRNQASGATEDVTASVVVNAAGPYVDHVLNTVFGRNDAHNVRLVGGSHIVVARKFDHDRCYILQNSDERIIFAIPYEDDYTLIGTTDIEHDEMPVPPRITPEEVDYLCAMASEYFADPVTKDDVVWTYSGVRPLFDDGASKAQEATRDYVIRRDDKLGEGTLINIFGGKITTFRRLAESMMDEVEALLGRRGPAWTRGAPLPGGDFPVDGRNALAAGYLERFPFVPPGLMTRLVRTYGTETGKVLNDAKSLADLGVDFGNGLFEAEVLFLMGEEWAAAADDILFRRTKLGIRASKAEAAALDDWIAANREGAVGRLT